MYGIIRTSSEFDVLVSVILDKINELGVEVCLLYSTETVSRVVFLDIDVTPEHEAKIAPLLSLLAPHVISPGTVTGRKQSYNFTPGETVQCFTLSKTCQ